MTSPSHGQGVHLSELWQRQPQFMHGTDQAADVVGYDLAQDLVDLPLKGLGQQAPAELGLDHAKRGFDIGAPMVVRQEGSLVVGEIV